MIGGVVGVVVVPEADAVAITGRMGGPVGAVPVDPDVGTLSLA